MSSEILSSYVDAGKITASVANILSTLVPESFVIHRSWGVGQIKKWDEYGNMIIDFLDKKNHVMQFKYASESLLAIPNTHILARTLFDKASVIEEANKNTVSFMRSLLESYGGQLSFEEISKILIPTLFDKDSYKKWIDKVKKKLKYDGHFQMPNKKNDPIILQIDELRPYQRFLEGFYATTNPKDQVLALDNVLKTFDHTTLNKEEIRILIDSIQSAAQRCTKVHTAKSLELLLIRDKIIADYLPDYDNIRLETVQLFKENLSKLRDIFYNITSSKYAAILKLFPDALEQNWENHVLSLTSFSEMRLSNEIFKLFVSLDKKDIFEKYIKNLIHERIASTDLLLWLCRDRAKTFPELIDEELFAAILAAMESDLHADIKSRKLEEFLFDDKEIIAEIFQRSGKDAARQAIRKVMLSPIFSDLNRRSLVARILKVHPELEFLIAGEEDSNERVEHLVVSWVSLDRRKAELEHLEKVLIPQNIRDISIARSYGDLRENFEFKSAKEQQAVLNRQKAELEIMLQNARGTNFENVDTSQVSIGTTVTFKGIENKKIEKYTILGAWDSAPEKGWISYQALIGRALLGKKVNDIVNLPDDHGVNRSTKIIKIEKFTDIGSL